MLRRLLSIVLLVSFGALVLITLFHSGTWRRSPPTVAVGDQLGPTIGKTAITANVLPDLRTKTPKINEPPPDPRFQFREPGIESTSPYPLGVTKPMGSNYTRGLVIAKTREEFAGWVETELDDMIQSGLLTPYIYVADDRRAPLHPPKNKGHEASVYLTYLIEFYDRLPDIAIFMHAHRKTWHNNEFLDIDAAQMVRRLSPERVTRDGYMNLRCDWEPGCPSWLHPGAIDRDVEKPEQTILADAWAEIFPHDAIPTVLAQPCCAQFAVSAERIRAQPKQRYVQIRDWVHRTQLSDSIAGRVFEYLWQYIFTSAPIHCLSVSACYCDGYGMCLGSPEAYESFYNLTLMHQEYEAELKVWMKQAEEIEAAKANSKDGKIDEAAVLHVPQIGRDAWLKEAMATVGAEMEEKKKAAFELGMNPAERAREAGRDWKDGDGF